MIDDIRLLSSDELLRSFVDEERESRIRDDRKLRLIAELDRRGAAAEFGYKDLARVLRDAVRWDIGEARKWIASAGLLSSEITPTGSELAPELPVTASAVAEGALSVEHVAALTKAMKNLPAEAETAMVDFARENVPAAIPKFGEQLAYAMFQNDPEPRDPEPAPPVNYQRKSWKNGQLEVKAVLDTVTGAAFEAMLDPLAKPRPDTSEEGPDLRSRPERDGDAFAELVNLMARADQLPDHGGEPVTLTVTMSYENLAEQVGAGMLDNGERVPADQVRQLACNAGIIPLVLGANSQPMNIGRKTRSFPAGIRRVLVARDRGCAFPGCFRPPRHCDAHHIQHWADDGETSVENAVLLCRHHHTLIHQSEWEVRLELGIPTFYPPAWLAPARNPRRNQLHAAA
ncbi:HNH endonuclease signature motif containing protein [Lentzea aerocolonigenes]|uniref:HNH endonuclease signature motif containing protein n=1 Tax=Lentzea aerocolonigenes TaxID=68170 RepID=UPI0005ECF67A|nr:HNH endonuclease signature motif containing protein [Lentzea aerocolonigenes]